MKRNDKKRIAVIFLSIALAAAAVFALSACGKTSERGSGSSEGSGIQSGGRIENISEKQRLRIVDGADEGNLLLAEIGGSDVYRVSIEEGSKIEITVDGKEADAAALADGMEVSVRFDGGILETYPARFSGVTALSAKTPAGGGYTDLCGFYLKVLEDLWNTDSALNENISAAGLDLSDAPGGLEESEIQAIAWRFGELHDVNVVTGTYEELTEQGYIDGEKLYWADGCFFSITRREGSETESYSLPVLRFDAQKWRSGTGAYFFNDCTAVWPEFGTWSEYTKGSEAIS